MGTRPERAADTGREAKGHLVPGVWHLGDMTGPRPLQTQMWNTVLNHVSGASGDLARGRSQILRMDPLMDPLTRPSSAPDAPRRASPAIMPKYDVTPG